MTVKQYNELLAHLNGDTERAAKALRWYCSQPISLRKSLKPSAVVSFCLDNQYIW